MKPLGNCLTELRGTLNGMGHLFWNDLGDAGVAEKAVAA